MGAPATAPGDGSAPPGPGGRRAAPPHGGPPARAARRRPRDARIAAAASLVAPGLGQALAGDPRRGVVVAGAAVAAAVVLAWLGRPAAWATAVPFVLLAAADAAALARGDRPRTARLALAAALPLYVVGWHATGIDLGRLATGFPKVRPLFGALLAPDFVDRERAIVAARVGVKTPCPDPAPAAAPWSGRARRWV